MQLEPLAALLARGHQVQRGVRQTYIACAVKGGGCVDPVRKLDVDEDRIRTLGPLEGRVDAAWRCEGATSGREQSVADRQRTAAPQSHLRVTVGLESSSASSLRCLRMLDAFWWTRPVTSMPVSRQTSTRRRAVFHQPRSIATPTCTPLIAMDGSATAVSTSFSADLSEFASLNDRAAGAADACRASNAVANTATTAARSRCFIA